jgi:hypothetical protein
MAWLENVCTDAICGSALGIINGVFGLSLFTSQEVEEINSLKKLALSVMEKTPEFSTEPVICEAIKNGQQTGLETFMKNAPPEVASTAVVTVIDIVCRKAFKERFKDVLMGACLNLIGC